MSDIVKKLRGYRPRYGWPEEYSTIVEPTMNHVAADEIERLRARETRLREALRDVNSVLFQARMYRGYEGGPLATPFASYAEDRARAALEEEEKG